MKTKIFSDSSGNFYASVAGNILIKYENDVNTGSGKSTTAM